MKVNIGVFAHNSKDWERVQSGDFSRPPATPDYEFVAKGAWRLAIWPSRWVLTASGRPSTKALLME